MFKQSPVADDEVTDAPPCSPPTLNAHDERWISAFKSQAADDDMRRRAANFARGRVRTIEQSGGLVASSDAEDLVADAIADTWSGVLAWRPDETPLLEHVKFAIRSRTRHDRNRAQRFPSVSLDAREEDEGDDRAAAFLAEVEDALAANAPATSAGAMIFAIEMFERARELAAGDLEVLALLDAMREGAADRAGLIEATGMSARRYESARRRLDTLVLELPAVASRRVSAADPGTIERRAA